MIADHWRFMVPASSRGATTDVGRSIQVLVYKTWDPKNWSLAADRRHLFSPSIEATINIDE